MKHKLLIVLCGPLLFGLFVGQGVTQENIRLEQAVIKVLENHPKLMVLDYRAQAMAARMRQALLAPSDRINLSLENFAETDEALAFRSVEAIIEAMPDQRRRIKNVL